MTLSEIAVAFELIASLAVVASLIYLGRQLSQNNATMRAQASQAWTELNFELAGPVAADREFSELWRKGANQFSSLDEIDQQRLIMYEWRAIEAWHHLFEMHQQKILPAAHWDKLTWIVVNLGKREAIQASWVSFRNAYDHEFQKFIDSQLPSIK